MNSTQGRKRDDDHTAKGRSPSPFPLVAPREVQLRNTVQYIDAYLKLTTGKMTCPLGQACPTLYTLVQVVRYYIVVYASHTSQEQTQDDSCINVSQATQSMTIDIARRWRNNYILMSLISGIPGNTGYKRRKREGIKRDSTTVMIMLRRINTRLYRDMIL